MSFDSHKRGANISHKYKFVWTAPAKVASRSVRDIFIEHCDLNPDWPSDEHPSNFTHVNIWPEEAGDDYIHIASIRHPYYRWLSYWKYGYQDNNTKLMTLKWTNRISTIYVTRLDRCMGIVEWNKKCWTTNRFTYQSRKY